MNVLNKMFLYDYTLKNLFITDSHYYTRILSDSSHFLTLSFLPLPPISPYAHPLKVHQNSKKAYFLPKGGKKGSAGGRSPPQELEVKPA